jgi:hypothetical protein
VIKKFFHLYTILLIVSKMDFSGGTLVHTPIDIKSQITHLKTLNKSNESKLKRKTEFSISKFDIKNAINQAEILNATDSIAILEQCLSNLSSV